MSMTVQAVGANAYCAPKKVAFKGNDNAQAVYQPKEKHTGKAIASGLMVGLGQFFDGRFKDGFKYILKSLGCSVLGGASVLLGMRMNNKAGVIVGMAGGVAAGIASIVNWVNNVKDAYHGGKKA